MHPYPNRFEAAWPFGPRLSLSRIAGISFGLGLVVLLALPRAAHAESTTASGAQYTSVCASRGVPIPPAWNSGLWKFSGVLSDKQEFILEGKEANVYYYESASPAGVCFALPRKTPGLDNVGTASFGVICQGKASGKACFWDNRKLVTTTSSMVIAPTVDVMDPPFIGGDSLKTHTGGMCTDCHSGNNAFIIHPGTALDVAADLRRPDVWMNPVVSAEWLQNQKPATDILSTTTTPTDEGSCYLCHNSMTVASFPQLSNKMGGYCSMVLRNAKPNQPKSTMPPFASPVAYTTHVNALEALCRTDPPPGPVVPPQPMPPSVRDAVSPALIMVVLAGK